MFDRRRRFLVEEDCARAKWLLSREKIGIELCILYHKTCYKNWQDVFTKLMENISGNEESVKFDSSFDILASEIETNVLKAWKVVTMSDF